MKEVTRRGFITRASVVGAVAVTGLAGLPGRASAAPAAAGAAAAGSSPDRRPSGPVPQDVVVHIRDANSSEVALIAGTEEYVYHDPKLVSSVLSKFTKRPKE